jgi:YVTN family beta-propeller protein
MRLPPRWLLPSLVAAATLAGAATAMAGGGLRVGPQGDGTGVTTVGWRVTPAGRQVAVGDRPLGLALRPDGAVLLASSGGQSIQSLAVVDPTAGTVRQSFPYPPPQALFVGVAWAPDGSRAYASGGGQDLIRVYDVEGATLAERAPIALAAPGPVPATRFPAGLAVTPDGKTLAVAENLADSLAVVHLDTGAVAEIPVGHRPYGVVVSPDGRTAYVSNWGDRTVTIVDLTGPAVRSWVRVGTHPSALATNPARPELYVADTDSDTVSVIDTTTNRRLRTIGLAPYPGAPVGTSPNGLAVSPDGRTLYVANAGNNDVAVVRLGGPAPARPADRVAGLIPTAWYPTALALAPDGATLYVANGKGLGAGPNPEGPNPEARDRAPSDQYVGSMMTGTVSVIPVPDDTRLAAYTRQVRADNDFDRRPGILGSAVIPAPGGRTSPIRHVIYVIKENRTYDQVLGNLGHGNGEPALNLFGDESAPNQRALARQFVTLDNFYADAEVSADGWNWSTAATANTYVQKTWPAAYSGRHRRYDFEGGELAAAPGRDPRHSYLWDALERAGVSYRSYGVWTEGAPAPVAPTAPGLGAHTDKVYPGFALAIPDQVRIDEWLREFTGYERGGHLPRFEFVRLPNDHTAGTKPGFPTPKAMVADNDLALGRLVDAVSHSRFWATTAIFVVEDDAQDGPDHVDAHRTIAQVVSPYTQTGRIDSTFYSTVSMLRTMELILGLPPLTQFDARAVPMVASFTDVPNLAPYDVRIPTQPRDEKNTAASPLAAESAAMDFSEEDRAPDDLLQQAVWQSVKGAGTAPCTVTPAGRAAAAAGDVDAHPEQACPR